MGGTASPPQDKGRSGMDLLEDVRRYEKEPDREAEPVVHNGQKDDWIRGHDPETFKPHYGVHTKEEKARAAALEREVLALLADGKPQHLSNVRNIDAIGIRFNELFWQKRSVNNGSWKQWLATLPGIELVYHASEASKTKGHATAIRLRPQLHAVRGGIAEGADAHRGGRRGSNGKEVYRRSLDDLLGDWSSVDGSSYHVFQCDAGSSLTVIMTRRSGATITRKGVIRIYDNDIWWGEGYRMTTDCSDPDTIFWLSLKTKAKFAWTRVSEY